MSSTTDDTAPSAASTPASSVSASIPGPEDDVDADKTKPPPLAPSPTIKPTTQPSNNAAPAVPAAAYMKDKAGATLRPPVDTSSLGFGHKGASPASPAPTPSKTNGIFKRMLSGKSDKDSKSSKDAVVAPTPVRVEKLALPSSAHPPSGPPSATPASGPPSPGSDISHGGGAHIGSPIAEETDSQSSHEHVRAWRDASAGFSSTAPPSRPPSRAPSIRSRREPSVPRGTTPTPEQQQQGKGVPATKAESTGGGFSLSGLIGGPKLSRRMSGSSRRSDSERGGQSAYGPPGPVGLSTDSVASLTRKYGVCEKVAIGKGATSVVRLAHKWERGSEEKLYAVKEFRKRRKNETEKEYVKKLTAEFCISSTLHHINVVETVDLVQDEQHHWCEVMEYCAGGDLYAAIKKGGMTREEVECCFGQIMRGVKYLHSQGVAHRDIKPENLYFNAKGYVKIGDYGASTVYRLPWEATIHMSTGLCGSEPYIAPEQFLSKPYDARLVDIWACAIVFYCLHFQELPWRVAQISDPLYAAYHAATLSASSLNPSSLPPTVSLLSPRACRPLLRKMLEPDPKNRCLVEDVLKDPWFASIEVCTEPLKDGSKPHRHVLPGVVP